MTAWSYSYLTAFETCARRFEMTRISKVVREPQGEALLHGNEVHKALELNIKEGRALPEKYKRYIPIVEAVKATPGTIKAELEFGLTEDLKPTTFFGRDVWVRGKLDVTIVNGTAAVVLDWKTGKPKSDPSQMQLFAAATFALHPEVEKVKSGFVWLAHDQVDKIVFERKDVDAIWGEFRTRVQRLELAAERDDYPPTPSGLCRNYCPVPRKLCEFSGKE